MGDLKDRTGVIPHPANEERVEHDRDSVADGGGDVRKLGNRDGRDSSRNRGGHRLEGRSRGRVRVLPQQRLEAGERRIGRPTFPQFGENTVGSDLVEFVESDQHRVCIRQSQCIEHAEQDSSVVESNRGARNPEAIKSRGGCGDEFNFGENSGFTDDVDVALDELAESTLLRPFGTPDGCNLDRTEHGRKFGAIGRIKAREWNGEVVAQPHVDEVVGRGRRRDVRRGQTALEDSERQSFVVATESSGQP